MTGSIQRSFTTPSPELEKVILYATDNAAVHLDRSATRSIISQRHGDAGTFLYDLPPDPIAGSIRVMTK